MTMFLSVFIIGRREGTKLFSFEDTGTKSPLLSNWNWFQTSNSLPVFCFVFFKYEQ